jgi:hypothetical protein
MTMNKPLKKRWARYPSILGGLCFDGLIEVARSNGMQVIGAFKAGWCVSASLALYGTSDQMAAVEAEWARAGNKLCRRRGKGGSLTWRIATDRPRDQWVDKKPAALQTTYSIETLVLREVEETGEPVRWRGVLYG